jgi:hypothetical protein
VKEPKEIPHIYGVDASTRNNLVATVDYLYALWAAIRSLYDSDGHLDEGLVSHFEEELHRTSQAVAEMKTQLTPEDLPF